MKKKLGTSRNDAWPTFGILIDLQISNLSGEYASLSNNFRLRWCSKTKMDNVIT
jgi:hypothetical protein